MKMPNKSSVLCGLLLALLGGTTASCTFYTSCPTATDGNGNGNGSMAGSGGGNGSGGSSSAIVDGELPPGEWTNATPEPSGLEDTCGPFFHLSAHPTRDEVIAGVFSSLWSTKDGGANWAPLGEGEGSEVPTNRASVVIFDPLDADSYWEAGIYGPGIFKTEDAGETFRQVGELNHLDSVSIDLTDPKRQTMLASEHEKQILYKSQDGGDTWQDISSAIPGYLKQCRFSLILDPSTFLLGCGGSFDPGSPGTLRSTDGGESWTEVYDDGGGAAPLVHSDGSIYWAGEAGNGLARSTNQGESWTKVVNETLLSVQPVELPDGRIASLTENAVVVSADSGTTWKKVSPPTPWKPVGFTYSAFQKAFFIYYFLCYAEPTQSNGDEIQRFDFDYEKY